MPSARKHIISIAIVIVSIIWFALSMHATADDVTATVNVRLDTASGPLSGIYRAGMTAYKMTLNPDYMKQQFYKDLRIGVIYLELTHIVVTASKSIDEIDMLCKGLDKDVLAVISAGGEIELNVAGMPRWLALLDSEEPISQVDRSPVWTRSAPKDHELFSKTMEIIAAHFRTLLADNNIPEKKGTLKYSIWGEPNIFYWRGTEEQFFDMYKAGVEGILRGDALADVGGIDVSHVEASKSEPAEFASTRPGSMMEHWLEYCHINSVPVDFVTWHRFGACPFPKENNDYRIQIDIVKAWLEKYGFANTSIQLADWTSWERRDISYHSWLSSDEDDEYSAAWSAAVLQALDAAGYNRQRHGLLFEQIPAKFPDEFGGDWGIMTKNGVVKARYNVFKLFSMLQGNRVFSENNKDFMNTLATSTGDTHYVLVSRFIPEDTMILKSLGLQLSLAMYKAGDPFKDEENGHRFGLPGRDINAWKEILSGTRPLNSDVTPDHLRNVIDSIARMYQQAQKERSSNIPIVINLTGLKPNTSYSIKNYLIDKNHSNAYRVKDKVNEGVINSWAKAAYLCNRDNALRALGFTDIEIAKISETDSLNPYAAAERLQTEFRDKAGDLWPILLQQQSAMSEGISAINQWNEIQLDCISESVLSSSNENNLSFIANMEPHAVSLWVVSESNNPDAP